VFYKHGSVQLPVASFACFYFFLNHLQYCMKLGGDKVCCTCNSCSEWYYYLVLVLAHYNRISGNFRVIKGSREKISRSKIFAVWAFHENLTRGEKVEEYGRDWCIRGCHVYHEIWEQLLEQLHCDNRLTCQFRPEQSRLYCLYDPHFPLDAVRMASSTSQFAAAIA